jgi:hypothetical protein
VPQPPPTCSKDSLTKQALAFSRLRMRANASFKLSACQSALVCTSLQQEVWDLAHSNYEDDDAQECTTTFSTTTDSILQGSAQEDNDETLVHLDSTRETCYRLLLLAGYRSRRGTTMPRLGDGFD